MAEKRFVNDILWRCLSLTVVCSKIPQYVHGEKKTKAVPDFGKLHERWQKKLEEGKVCQKKPQTMVTLFLSHRHKEFLKELTGM